ncbi:response regulator [Ancylomarina euxinus]|uniref:histidine kinase n=1 Tax=Ancylomarina euxinus TaxID=2283627 RepID=A0A425XZP2_9BACT|nr:ATP-binding protein [Ancylomarina euxinus]MCZ4695493.1 ATP-binding protein [Ancylomarina euxinus]MUP15689.1 response regulator [Ancylomarina euxinus]RRG20682.1 response regulator [Ancylomarina euxinus]
MVKNKDQHIRVKVIAGYLVLLITIVSAGFIGHSSYKRLMNSVSQLSKPDAEISRMNHLLTDLSEAENHIRVYSLTKKEQYLNLFVKKVKSIKYDLDSLRSSNIKNAHSIQMIDSMIFLIDVRSKKLDAFARIKKVKESINYTEQALQELSDASKYSRTEFESSITKRTIVDTIKKIKKKIEEPKSFLGIKFGKKKESKYEVVDRVIERQEVGIDSSFIQKQDSLFNSFKEELELSRRKEQEARERLMHEELKLVDENSIILQKIKKLLTELEQQQIRDITQKVTRTEQIAKDSIILITIVIIVGFIFGVLFILFTLLDLSKSDYLKKQLILAKGKAEKLAKVKEEFLASMSHEIRTPLNALIGFSRQLEKTEMNTEQTKYVEVIGNSSNHLLGLVNDILDLAKIEAGKLVIEKQSFEPKKLIQEVYSLLSVSANKKNVKFSWTYEGEDQYLFESDPFRLKQILLNLGSNAIKFTEVGAVSIKAVMETDADKNTFKVSLIDTGIGISSDKLEHVFEDFSQAESFSARKYGGTGLGLSISRRLARMLGGDLSVSSELGKGSEFRLDLPITKGEVISEESLVKHIHKVSDELKQKRILVAEDDEYSSLLMQTIFKGWNLNASFVNNGLKALECMQNKKFDILLTDIHMPEMGGVDLCKHIRTKLKSEMPIIALTANVRQVDLDKYIKEGMSAYLLKPFEEDALLEILCEQLSLEVEMCPLGEVKSIYETYHLLFDLSEVKKFSGGDNALVNQILTSFMRIAKESIQLLKDASDDKNYKQLGEVAHRMLSSYRQLKIESASEILLELEKMIHQKSDKLLSLEEVNQSINKLEELSNQVFEQIDDLQKNA